MPDRTSSSSRHGHSHRYSDTSRTSRSRRSSSAAVPPSPSRAPPPPVPSASASRRPSAVARDSAQSTFDSSVFSRSSVSTSFTTDSRVTSLSSPQYPQPTASYRDSFISIVDDPFFQRFDPAFSAHAPSATRLSSDSEADDADADDDDGEEEEEDGDDERPESDDQHNSTSAQAADGHATKSDSNWPPPRRESLTIGPAQYWSHSAAMESFNIAVIGAEGVGKSSFVQRVLGLQRPSISNTSSVRMAVDNLTHFITLLELDLEYFELSPDQPIQWPKQMNGHIVPRVDGALILYDVMQKESIRDLPTTVAALTNSGLPAILVACKCEHPEDDWEVDAEGMANHKFFQACIGTYKITKDDSDTAKACLQSILKAAVANRREEQGENVSRRRAQSAAYAEPGEAPGSRAIPEQSKHSRASSDLSLLRGFPNAPIKDGYRGQAGRSPRLMQQSAADGDSNSHQIYNSMLRSTTGIRLDRSGTDSFLDMDESDAESFRYSEEVPILQRSDDGPDKPSKENGVTFDSLVDRLLAPRLSKPDNNFSEIFLCLYRKFAAPGELFSAILERLDRVREDKTAHYLSKTATQLRMIEVIAKWVSLYPGDFARPATRRNLEDFIRHLSTEPIFSIAAQQMRRNLHYNVVEDDDTGWANSDESGDKAASQLLSREMSELAVGISTMQFDDDNSGRPSASSDASQLDRGSSVSSQFHFHTYDEYEREAASLEPRDHLPMNKTRYHIFMDIPNDDIADELTRIDWIMFSSIRIRDFVRHVSLSASQKEKCKSLKNVNRMIAHFNHIAKWVANMILLRDKPKHRAQMLEKFMHIAVKLRLLNNYNGLAAIVAGINGTAIHRLAQTRALVPEVVINRFTRLCILMGTQKSHFAYRLAWENSPLPRIPFIPLHRRDLVSAEEGSKTFVGSKGDRINWKKFEVLGEVLLPVMKSQGAAYPNLARHDNARELILGCRMPTDEEEIYQRSVQVESGAFGGSDFTRKKSFPWFATK
ncbi:hypothetical protein NLU13_6249 [Sarocladium strictum]|uniref:Ras guanine nucleotide exchange factor A n=1 Tax=Sarocladium strictum TaxID=5046 RepID=A0AA39GHX8_SARSR|nr:hypothetical protein NLU13_6249 [Sarocladium strictum]